MNADATTPAWNGYLLAVACSCGVVFERRVTPEEADVEVTRLAAMNEALTVPLTARDESYPEASR